MATKKLTICTGTKFGVSSELPPIPAKSRKRGLTVGTSPSSATSTSPRSVNDEWPSSRMSDYGHNRARFHDRSSFSSSLNTYHRDSDSLSSTYDKSARANGHEDAVRQYRSISQRRRFHRKSALDALQRMSTASSLLDDSDDDQHSRKSSIDASWIEMVMSQDYKHI